MANHAADRFLKNLIAASCRRFKPDAAQVELYRAKLGKWYLSDDQWAAAMSRFASEYLEEGLPALPLIYSYLKAVQTDIDKPSGQCFLMFTVGGVRYAQRISDPSRASAPLNATDIHLVIPSDMQDRTQEKYYGQQVDDLVANTL